MFLGKQVYTQSSNGVGIRTHQPNSGKNGDNLLKMSKNGVFQYADPLCYLSPLLSLNLPLFCDDFLCRGVFSGHNEPSLQLSLLANFACETE